MAHCLVDSRLSHLFSSPLWLPFNILTTQPTIVKKLRGVYSNPNTLQLYLNMIILLRRYNKEEVDKLIKFRNSLRDEIVRTRKKNLNSLNDDLPTIKYLNDKLDKLSGTKYISFSLF